jgi:hypothetical protein
MIINQSQHDKVTKFNYHWFPSDFVTWSCLLWLIIIDFPQTLSLGHVCYRTTVGEKLTIANMTKWQSLREINDNFPHGRPITNMTKCQSLREINDNYHWFPSDFVTWSSWLWLIIIDFPQTLSLGYVGYGTIVGKLSLISLRFCQIINHNQFDQVTKSEGNQW